jgi:hypothetical protein
MLSIDVKRVTARVLSASVHFINIHINFQTYLLFFTFYLLLRKLFYLVMQRQIVDNSKIYIIRHYLSIYYFYSEKIRTR